MNQLELQFEFEEWKPIEGYEGRYEVSNYGRVKSLKTNDLISQRIDKNGYYQLKLHKDGKARNYLVHRLVAKAFIPNPNNFPIINHIDINPLNNHVDNLEWCSYKYNLNFKTRNETLSRSLKLHYFAPIRCIETQKIYESPYELDNEGFNHTFIYSCCRCDIECAYGLHWEYA